jgi:hypothetical protein
MDLNQLEGMTKNLIPADMQDKIDNLPQGAQDAINKVLKNMSPGDVIEVLTNLLENTDPADISKQAQEFLDRKK